MKRYYVDTNGYAMVVFADNSGKAFVIGEESFDEPLTLDVAKNADYGNLENCETAEECAYAMGYDVFSSVFEFKDIAENAEKVVKF